VNEVFFSVVCFYGRTVSHGFVGSVCWILELTVYVVFYVLRRLEVFQTVPGP
jgi:hypothetical protein